MGCRDDIHCSPGRGRAFLNTAPLYFQHLRDRFIHDNWVASFSDAVTGEGRGGCQGKESQVSASAETCVVRTGSGEERGNDLGASWTLHRLPLKELWLSQMTDGIFN